MCERFRSLDVVVVLNLSGLDCGLILDVVGDGDLAVVHISHQSLVIVLGEAIAPLRGFQRQLDIVGFGVITGDQTQKDLPSGATSGLDTALKVLKNIDDIGFCYLTSSDVVRHPLVQKIVKAYDDYEKKTASKTARGERKTPAVKNTRKGNNR